MTNIYTTQSKATTLTGFLTGITGLAGLSADDFLYKNTGAGPAQYYYLNNLTATAPSNTDTFWTNIYFMIYQCNATIEGLTTSSTLTPAVKQQLMGEAKFMRAFGYFYLVNFYGNVPLVLTTDYTVNATVVRSSTDQVYTQIIADLKDADKLLSSNYLGASLLTTTPERVRPTKWAAEALLARTYLYTKDWPDAVTQSTAVIANVNLFSLVNLDDVFLKNSNEAIWQLQPVGQGANTNDGVLFVIPSTGLNQVQSISLSNGVLNSFEPNDDRKTHWVGSVTVSGTTYFFPYKYKKTLDPNIVSVANMTEYEMVLRLGEQFLIRAEAEANGAAGGLSAAISDLNIIRARAGLGNYAGSTTDQTAVLNAIYHERRVELFSEWGHRWLDLKRTGMLDAVMGAGGACAAKGGTWNTNQQLYPIPLSELQANPKLVQNPGY
jgi:hypothetical protein